MMIRILKIFISCFFIAASFASCSKEEVDIEDYEQIFSVQQFDNQLNSVTSLDDSIYIVGGKTGELFEVQNTKVLCHYATASDHIYTAYKDSLGSWWVGTHNDGLHYWDGKKPDMGTPTRKYIIPEKATGYSVYNILPLHNDSILVGTSNGLYRAAINGSNILDSLYCPLLDICTGKPKPVEFRTPVVISSDSIFYPSQDGIYYVGKSNRKMWFGKAKDFKALCLSPDSKHLYALSKGNKGNNDFLWIFKNKKNPNECTPIKLSFSADHLLQVHHKLYLLSRSDLYATLADDLEKGNLRFTRVPLKRRLPEKTKSGIIYSQNDDRIRIVTERAVLSFPARSGMADLSGMMRLACLDKSSDSALYYLNLQNELFKYDPRSDSLLAQKVLELAPSATEVTALHVDKGSVFYEVNHTSLYKRPIQSSIIPLWNRFQTKQIAQYSRSTALLIENDTVYVGIKDSILSFPILSSDKKYTISSDTYATHLRKAKNSVVATTLNDGLQFIDGYSLSANFKRIRFQRDYCVANDSLALLLNNHVLYLLKDTDIIDSVALKNYDRIFVSPNGCEGIAVSTDTLQWFSLSSQDSITLGKATFGHYIIDDCIPKGDTLFISTEAGVEIVAMSQDTVDTEKAPIYLSFSEGDFKNQERNRSIIMWVVIALILISVVAGFWVKSEKNKKDREYLKEGISRLCKSLDYITDENLKKLINELKDNIDSDTIDKNLYSRLHYATDGVAFALVEKINKQIPTIKATKWNESNNLIKKCKEAKKSKDTDKMLEVIVENDRFLKKVKDDTNEVNNYLESVRPVVIQGITDKLYEESKNNNIQKALRDGRGKDTLNSLKQLMQQLNTDEIINAVKNYIKKNKDFEDKSGNYESTQYLKKQLDELITLLGKDKISNEEMRDLLIHLKTVKRHVEMAGIIKSIGDEGTDTTGLESLIKDLFNLLIKSKEDTDCLQHLLNNVVTANRDSKVRDLLAFVMATSRCKDNQTISRSNYTHSIYELVSKLGKHKHTSPADSYKSDMSRLRNSLLELSNKLKDQTREMTGSEYITKLLIDCQNKIKD